MKPLELVPCVKATRSLSIAEAWKTFGTNKKFKATYMWLDTREIKESLYLYGDSLELATESWKAIYWGVENVALIGVEEITSRVRTTTQTSMSKTTDEQWAKEVGCTDEQSGRIGLFALLQLIARSNTSSGYVLCLRDSSIIKALQEADPKMIHWHMEVLTSRHIEDHIKVWRRKEWNESYAKAQADEAKKADAYTNEMEYQADKEVIMAFFLETFDGNRKLAEKMFAPMANNREKMKARVKSIQTALERFNKLKK